MLVKQQMGTTPKTILCLKVMKAIELAGKMDAYSARVSKLP
jgi:hypothetical protein